LLLKGEDPEFNVIFGIMELDELTEDVFGRIELADDELGNQELDEGVRS